MIQIKQENIGSIIYNLKNNLLDIGVVIFNDTIIWRKGGNIQSCFGAGYWQDNYPWTDNIGWKDNK